MSYYTIFKRYYTNKGWDYGHPQFEINNNFNFKNYYWSLIPKLYYSGPFENNVMKSGYKEKYYFSVIDIAQYAIANYETYLKTKNKINKKIFLDNCNWLIENQTNFNGITGVWILPYSVPLYAIEPPWISALGQGLAISALTRAYIETGEIIYLNSACEAVKVYNIDKQNGGVMQGDKTSACYEEYPTIEPTCVLNGHISAIWGLNDLYNITKDDGINYLINKGITYLKENLFKYDIGYWSRYDLNPNFNNIASYFYHDLHVKQMNIMYTLTNIDIFKQYELKWKENQFNFFKKTRAVFGKIIFRLGK